MNLLSTTAKTGLLKSLESRRQLDWATRLDQVVIAVHKAASEQRKVGILKHRPQAQVQDWLIEPIAERDQHSMLVAAGGTGKSLMSIALCASAVTGQPFLPGMTVGAFNQNCLYLDWETDQATHEHRLTQLTAGIGVEFPADRIHYIRMTMPLSEDVPFLYEYILRNNIGMVVVDSVGMATGGDMNSQEDAISYVNAARAIGNVTFISIHHVGWGDNTRNTGSRYFENAARSVWLLEKDQESDEPTSHLDLSHRKANNGMLRPPIGMKVEFGEAIRYYGDKVSDHKQSVPAQIRDVLSIGKLSLKAIYADMEKVPQSTIRGTLGRMEKAGEVIRFDGTDRRNPEYELATKQEDVRGSVTPPPLSRNVTENVTEEEESPW